jgi:hypothetical protein
MKGKLKQTEYGWVVEYCRSLSLPLHPDDEECVNDLINSGLLSNENNYEIRFEIFDEKLKNRPINIYVRRYAKIKL